MLPISLGMKIGMGSGKSGGIVVPDMLANWVGDDSPQTIDGAVFNSGVNTWVDRISGITLAFPAAAGLMRNIYFGGAKAYQQVAGQNPPGIATSGISTVSGDYTMFFVTRVEALTASQVIFDTDHPTNAERFITYNYVSTAATLGFPHYDEVTWTGGYASDSVVADLNPLSTDVIHTLDMQSDEYKVYKNGVLIKTATTPATRWASRVLNGNFSILGLYNDTTRLNLGATAEIRIYPALDAEQRAVVEAELAGLYGTPLVNGWVDDTVDPITDDTGDPIIFPS